MDRSKLARFEQRLSQLRQDVQTIRDRPPAAPPAPPPTQPTGGSDFMRGLEAGGRSAIGSLQMAGGLAAQSLGSEAGRDYAYDQYARQMAAIQEDYRDIYSPSNWRSFGDFIDAAQYWLGYAAPQLAVGLGTGFAAKQAATAVGKRVAGRALQQRMAAPTAQNALSQGAAREAVERQIQQEITRPYGTAGFVGGTAVASTAQTTGETYGGAIEYADEQGLDRSDINLGRVYAGGVAAGALDTASTLLTGGLARIGPLRQAGDRAIDMLTGSGTGGLARTRRAAVAATGAGLAGGLTEAAQEFPIRYGTGRPGLPSGEELLTSAFAGAVPGATIGGVRGAVASPTTAAEREGVRQAERVERDLMRGLSRDERIDRVVARMGDAAEAERLRVAERAAQQAAQTAPTDVTAAGGTDTAQAVQRDTGSETAAALAAVRDVAAQAPAPAPAPAPAAPTPAAPTLRRTPLRAVPKVTVQKPKNVDKKSWDAVQPNLIGSRDRIIRTIYETSGLGTGQPNADTGAVTESNLTRKGKSVLKAWEAAQASEANKYGVTKPPKMDIVRWNRLIGTIAGVNNEATVREIASQMPGLRGGEALDNFMNQWRTAVPATESVATPEPQAAPEVSQEDIASAIAAGEQVLAESAALAPMQQMTFEEFSALSEADKLRYTNEVGLPPAPAASVPQPETTTTPPAAAPDTAAPAAPSAPAPAASVPQPQTETAPPAAAPDTAAPAAPTVEQPLTAEQISQLIAEAKTSDTQLEDIVRKGLGPNVSVAQFDAALVELYDQLSALDNDTLEAEAKHDGTRPDVTSVDPKTPEGRAAIAQLVTPPRDQPAQPGVGIGAALRQPQMLRAMFFAIQGATQRVPQPPSDAPDSTKLRYRAQQIGVKQVQHLLEIGEYGPQLYQAFVNLHTSLQELDASSANIDRTIKNEKVDLVEFTENRAALRDAVVRDFAVLESLIGRREALIQMKLAKSSLWNWMAPSSTEIPARIKRTFTTRSVRNPKDWKGGIHFSRYYRQYRNGQLQAENIPLEQFRTLTERTAAGYKENRLKRILSGASLPPQVAKSIKDGNRPDSEAYKYLKTREVTSTSPIEKAVLLMVRTALNKQGLLQPGQIRFVLRPNQSANSAGAVGLFETTPDAESFGRITLYSEGMNNIVILHELIHAATVRALSDPKFKNMIPVRQLRSYGTNLLKAAASDADRSRIANTYGTEVVTILDTLRALLDPKTGRLNEDGVLELLSYGLTNESLQRYMMDVPATASKQTYTLRSLWRRFVQLVSNLLSAVAGSDKTSAKNIEPFLVASARLLQVISDTENFSDPKVKKTLMAMGGLPLDPNASFSAEAMANDPAMAAAAQEAAKNSASAARQLALLERERAEIRRQQEKEAQERVAEQARRERAEEELARGVSAVPEGDTALSRPIGTIDSLTRNVFNLALGFFDATKGKEFEQVSQELRERYNNKMLAFLAADFSNEPLKQMVQRFVNKAGASVLSGWGTDIAFRGFQYAAITADRTRGIRLGELVHHLQGLNTDQQQKLLQYLETRSDSDLQLVTQDPDEAGYVRKLVAALDDGFAKAKEQGLISAEFLSPGTSLLDFVRLSTSDRLRRNRNVSLGNITPSFTRKKDSAYHMLDDISSELILSPDGDPVASVKVGQQYKLARQTAYSDLVAVSPQITVQAMQDRGLVHHTEEMDRVYVVRRVRSSPSGTQVSLGRLLSKEELEARDQANSVVASLATAAHEWARRAEALKFQEQLLVTNDGLDADAKWISNTPPVGVPENRILESKKGLERGKEVLADEYRMAGYWVYVPETASDTWGPFAGKYIAAPVYSAIADTYDTSPYIDSQVGRAVTNIWKKNMTVYNTTTWQNNVISNFVFAYFHDIPARNIKLGLKLVMHQQYPGLAKKYFPPLTREEAAIIAEVRDMGIELVSHKYNELDLNSSDSLQNALSTMRRTGNSNSAKDIASVAAALEGVYSSVTKVDGLFSDFYSNQDNVFRIAAYITHIQNARKLGKTVDERAKLQAGEFARNAFVNYRIDAPFINALRYGKMGGIALPFLAWTYRAVGIVGETAVTKPWKLLNTMGAIYALNALAYGFEGADEDEERNLLPKYMQGNIWGIPGLPTYIRLPMGTPEQPVFYNVGAQVPLGTIFSMSEYSNLPTALVPGGPAMVVIQAIFNTKFFGNQTITNELDKYTAEHGKDFLAFAWQEMGPRILVNGFKTGNDIWTQREGITGSNPAEWVQLSRLLGINMREINLEDAAYYQSLDIQRIEREARTAINRANREYFRLGNPPDYDSLYENALRLSERAQEKINQRLGIE